jgi:hypothetical protein
MSIRTRLAKLEAHRGARRAIRGVRIYYGSHIPRHAMGPPGDGMLPMEVPCPDDGDPVGRLRAEQARMVRLAPARAVAIHIFDACAYPPEPVPEAEPEPEPSAPAPAVLDLDRLRETDPLHPALWEPSP